MFTLRLLADGEARLVHFYHYTDWPHELAPNNSEDVWQLHSALRLSGCGRAGTYAALELLNARLNAPDAAELSVAQAVEAVRRVRFGAVQSPQQLSFVGLVLMDRLLVGRKTKALVPADVQAAYLELKPAAYERISADEPPADEF
ncbi:Tyrosine-protein phosphatase domain-containing protein [Aphelenchoides fujianensis]|nr:Tyrosine-protein phosphatase domain-containing protein [Aphelenchoides fujianensis]